MKVLFLGGDKRQLEIINHLVDNEHDIDVVGYDKYNFDRNVTKVDLNRLKMNKYNVIIFPVSGVYDDYSVVSDFDDKKLIIYPDLLTNINDKAIIFTGIKTKVLDEMLKYTGRDPIVLMDKEDIKKRNSIPTAEGIIADLIMNTKFTIDGSKIFVLGYGHVGKQLTDKLKALGAILTVGVLTKEEYKDIIGKNMSAIITNDRKLMHQIIPISDIIVNTVPDVILDEDYLRCVNKNVYILDIASHPHGVDFKTANELQIRNKLYMGIPAKVAPKTSGQILAKEIESIIERSKS